MNHVDKIITLLVNSATKMNTVYAELCKQPQLGPSDQFIKEKIEKWTNNLGSALGHFAEFEIYYKHRFVKGRRVASPVGQGDVVIGDPDDPFAKTIQSKAVTTAAPNTVTTDLQAAMQQLAGLNREKPRPNDNYVAVVTIYNMDNPWPFTAQARSRALPPLSEVEKNVVSEATNAVRLALSIGNSQGQNTLADVFKSSPKVSLSAPGPRSTRLAVPGEKQQTTHYDMITGDITTRQLQTWVHKATLLVKIKWPFGYGYDDNGTLRFIKALTIRFAELTNPPMIVKRDFLA